MIVSLARRADMVMMADLGLAGGGLVAQHLLAIFAQAAVHHVHADIGLAHALDDGLDHQRVVFQIVGLENLNLGMAQGGFIGSRVDALHQHAGEEEIGKYDDTLEAELGGAVERGADLGVGDAGEGDFGPAVAEAFPQHARQLGDIAVGVGIVGAAPDDQQ